MDIVSGATSLDSLEKLIARGLQCRFLPDVPRLHAKVYIFGEECAFVTSANLTARALDSNIEVGTQVSVSDIHELVGWFDGYWNIAEPLDALRFSSLRQQTAALRLEFSLLRARCRLTGRRGTHPGIATGAVPLQLDSSLRYFLCNTDRAHSNRSASGGFEREDLMHVMSYAAAWEKFSYPNHMKEVTRGDIIFMYANLKGIIAIGRAKDKCESLPFGSRGRIFDGTDTTEWRVPVDWLVWEDERPCPWGPHANQTFLNVSKDNYASRREAVIQWLRSLEGAEAPANDGRTTACTGSARNGSCLPVTPGVSH